jgi:hypothetical protein
MHITELGLSPAALACLQAAAITDVGDLTTRPASDLIASGHFTRAELYEIICCLNQHGLTLPPVPRGALHLPNTRNRELLRLRLIEGLTLAQIAKRTGVSPTRARQILVHHYGLSGTRT